MIIKVEISEETWARMLTGKRVEGTLGLDKWSGKKDFNAFHRKPKKRLRDRLIKKLPWGWVKESACRTKRHTSMPKDLTFAQKLAILDQENKLAKEALMKQELFNQETL